MKPTFQWNRTLTTATILSTAWFGFWLFFFQPVPQRSPVQAIHPETALLPPAGDRLAELNDPTLFALPNPKGFSGEFVPEEINQRLALEKPDQPVIYETSPDIRSFHIDPSVLYSSENLPQSSLPIPGYHRRYARTPESGRVFFSPELAERIPGTVRLDLQSRDLPQTLRAQIEVSTDGRVRQIFFDTPVENAELQRALRELRFAPAAQPSSGQVSIQFSPGEEG